MIPGSFRHAGGRPEPFGPATGKTTEDLIHLTLDERFYKSIEHTVRQFDGQVFGRRALDGLLVFAEHLAGEMWQYGPEWPAAVLNSCLALSTANEEFFNHHADPVNEAGAFEAGALALALTEELAVTLAKLILDDANEQAETAS